ncbi:hypothetical protein LA76x_4650 [Lysobacter antibioticus]|uniref:Uncharacterized protein n=1 Tax=Lysobacter antibioticus TaxID=84531 RepID=A0A0S2FGS9_LYSAN|nr:hypothetical protein LA76x_4650 [Lysobacter antibioticus]
MRRETAAARSRLASLLPLKQPSGRSILIPHDRCPVLRQRLAGQRGLGFDEIG